MSKQYRWGIIAPGAIASEFAADLRLVNGAILKAVASRSMDRALKFAKKYRFEKAYDSYESLAKDSEIDIIYIASPHVFHAEHSLLCLKNGKHVLCEKPAAMNRKELDVVLTEAKKQGKFFMEGLWSKFLPSYKKAQELIGSGIIGTVHGIHADFGFRCEPDNNKRWLNKSLGGGSLMDIGIYNIFAAIDFAGQPDNIMSVAQIGETYVDESCSCIFEYKNKKILASLSSSLITNQPTEAIYSGTEGNIKIAGMWHKPGTFDIVVENTNYFHFCILHNYIKLCHQIMHISIA